MTILKYDPEPDPEEMTRIMKEIFAKMGYDTPEKRQQWWEENNKPLVMFGTRIEPSG